ncbi:MAG TPA: hypothetical protein VJ742_08565 [Nitrososphaera sp.]|nr:hypothetical protein [Nitrososphaera sp.]
MTIHVPFNTASSFTDLSRSDISSHYPGLKHLWHKDDVTDSVTFSWTDRINSCVFSKTGVNTFSKDSNGVYFSGNTSVGKSGTLTNPSQKHFILFVHIGLLSTNSQTMSFYDTAADGDAGYIQMNFKESQSFFAGTNQTDYLTLANTGATAFTAAQSLALLYVNFTDASAVNSAFYRKGTSGGNATLVTSTIGSGITASLSGTPAFNASFTNTEQEILFSDIALSTNCHRFNSIGILVLEDTPTDRPLHLMLKAAAEWMYDNPGHIYPGFYGIS